MAKNLNQLPKGSRIVVDVDPSGTIDVHLEGIQGSGCEGFLDNLADLFEVVKDGRTPEFGMAPDQVVGA